MMLRITFLHLLVSALVTAVVSQSPPPAPDVESALARRPHYSMFLDLLKSSGLLNDLKTSSGFTLFAPTNLAMSGLENDEYNNLKTDHHDLQEFIKYHVTEDAAWHTGGKSNDRVFVSLDNGLPIRINEYHLLHTVSANGCNITEKNIRLSNGYIQGVECVLRAPDGDVVKVINDHPELTTMSRLMTLSGLDAILQADKNLTVFAPMNEAFDDLDPQVINYLERNPKTLMEVLLYHVVQKTTLYRIGMRHSMAFETSDKHHDQLVLLEGGDDGEEFFLNHAALDETDLSATNGVVHTVDQLLIPASVLVELEDMGFGHLLG